MKLIYKEWGNYAAYRTHNIDTDELRKYLEENFVDSDVQDLTDTIIGEILYHSSDWEDAMIYDKETGEAYHLADIVIDWVQDNLYNDDYDWELCETDVCDDELIETEK
jgi:hypothetical protein